MMSKNKNGRTAKREAGGAGHSSVVPSSAALRRARILVVGDVMLDRYWFGDVSRISPEAPVPVVKFKRNEERPGGASLSCCASLLKPSPATKYCAPSSPTTRSSSRDAMR